MCRRNCEPEALAGGGARDEARDVGDGVGDLARGHDAEVRGQRRERVVGDLRPGGRHRGDEGGLARGGEADEADVGHALEFEHDGELVAGLAEFGEAGHFALGTDEGAVAAPSSAAVRDRHFGADPGQVGEDLAVGVDDGAVGDGHPNGLAGGAVPVRALAVLAVAALQAGLEVEVEQGVHVRVYDEDHITPVAAVSAVGSAQRLELLTVDRHTAVATLAGNDLEIHAVYETCHRSSVATAGTPEDGARGTC